METRGGNEEGPASPATWGIKGWSSEAERGGAQRWKGVELEADWGVASKRGSATKAVTVVHVPEGLRSFIQRSLGVCSE